MKIKMRQLAAGPQGVWKTDDVLDLDRDVAMTLIAGGYAVAVETQEHPHPLTAAVPVETAELPMETVEKPAKYGKKK